MFERLPVPSSWPETTLALFLSTAVVVSCLTRLSISLSGNGIDQKLKKVPLVPYWIPGLGHALAILKSPSRLLSRGPRISGIGLFTINVLSTNYYIVCNANLARLELEKRKSTSFTSLTASKLLTIGGLAQASADNVAKSLASIDTAAITNDLITKAITGLQETLVNLVSGCISPVDQMPWEKLADTVVLPRSTSSEDVNQCDLYVLIRSFTMHNLFEVFLPSAPPETLMELTKAMQKLQDSALPLHWGIPRWLGLFIPLPSLHAAHRAREDLVQILKGHYQDIGFATEQHLAASRDESGAVRAIRSPCEARNAFMQAHNVPDLDRARADVTYLFELTRDVGSMVFWTLSTALSASVDVRDELAQETQKVVSVEDQAPLIPGSNITEPPKMNFNLAFLQNESGAPLLSKLVMQAVRQHSRATSSRPINQDEHCQVSDATQVVLQSGSRVTIAYELLSLSAGSKQNYETIFKKTPSGLSDQALWDLMDADRALLAPSTIKPFVMAIVSGLLTIWEIHPASQGRGWDGRLLPQGTWEGLPSLPTRSTSGMDIPTRDFRVDIKKRR